MRLRCSKLCDLSLTPLQLAWPWVFFSPQRTAFAVPTDRQTLAVRTEAALQQPTRLVLHEALALPVDAASDVGTGARRPGLHAVALHPDGRSAVAFGWYRDLPVACVSRADAAPELVDLGPALGDMGPLAASFTRDGQSLWVSAENDATAAIARLRLRDLALEAKVAFPAAPPPAMHELSLHPVEDAVLLSMACGEDGTFLRVARHGGGRLELIPGVADGGIEPCGVAETTDDGQRVCLVMFDRVELRRWPDLVQVAQADVEEELVANYNGMRVGGRFIVSATLQDDVDEPRALVMGDELRVEDDAPAPPGMWAGRLGSDRLVTIDRVKGEERSAFVYEMRLV